MRLIRAIAVCGLVFGVVGCGMETSSSDYASDDGAYVSDYDSDVEVASILAATWAAMSLSDQTDVCAEVGVFGLRDSAYEVVAADSSGKLTVDGTMSFLDSVCS